MGVTRLIRWVVGAALVAAGLSLVGPLAARLADAARTPDAGGTAPGPWVGPASPHPVAFPPVAPLPSGHALPAAGGAITADDPWAALPAPPPGSDSAGGLQLDRHPPPPPAPLPPAPPEFAQTSPAIGAAYRSTLRVPPPDLLDAEAPPPAVAWAASAVPVAASSIGRTTPAAALTDDVAVPATYRVRDGDDLAGIAGRFYGHPSAASAVWAANRDTIQHPDLLPIGVELRLPPRWAVEGRRQPGLGAIEPAAYARPVAPPVDHVPPPRGAGGTAWLAPAPESAPPATPAAGLPPAPATASVRVGPGETLPMLARRLYGDPAMAEQIFAVNRDRLRSPELVVAGTELRLPRPVTAPWP